MDETIEKIINYALKEVKDFTYTDQNFILEDVANKLQGHANDALMAEYGIIVPEE